MYDFYLRISLTCTHLLEEEGVCNHERVLFGREFSTYNKRIQHMDQTLHVTFSGLSATRCFHAYKDSNGTSEMLSRDIYLFVQMHIRPGIALFHTQKACCIRGWYRHQCLKKRNLWLRRRIWIILLVLQLRGETKSDTPLESGCESLCVQYEKCVVPSCKCFLL